jgi:hypothetical protein
LRYEGLGRHQTSSAPALQHMFEGVVGCRFCSAAPALQSKPRADPGFDVSAYMGLAEKYGCTTDRSSLHFRPHFTKLSSVSHLSHETPRPPPHAVHRRLPLLLNGVRHLDARFGTIESQRDCCNSTSTFQHCDTAPHRHHGLAMAPLARGDAWPSVCVIVVLILSFALTIGAQEGTILDHSKLPTCAFQCTLLLQAQSLCVPPTAPAQGQAIYQTCFCNSNYLAPYKAGSPTGVCDAACPAAADEQQILSWYKGLCTGGAVVIPNNGVSGSGTSTTSAASTATATTSSSSLSSSHKSSHPTW